MKSERAKKVSELGSLVAVLSFVTVALWPYISTDGPAGGADDAYWAVLVAAVACMAFLGLYVLTHGQPVRAWLLPVGLTAFWGMLVGGLAMLTNQSAWKYENDNRAKSFGRAVQYRMVSIRDEQYSMSLPDQEVKRRIQQEEESARLEMERMESHVRGMWVGGMLLLFGVEAAACSIALRRRGSSASSSREMP